MDFIEAVRRTKREHWSDAISWLFLNLIGGLMPLWGLWILLRLFSQSIGLGTFTERGEFALYTRLLRLTRE